VVGSGESSKEPPGYGATDLVIQLKQTIWIEIC
jgi:hypothetical protein